MDQNQKIEKFYTAEEDFSSYENASFGSRAIAFFIDGILIGVFGQVIQAIVGVIFSMPAPNSSWATVATVLAFSFNLIILPLIYYIPMMKKRGQTIGKVILKIRVINDDNSSDLQGSTIIMREFFGKFVSSLFLMLGYIVYLFGKETWHDRIAKTRVIAIK